MKSFLLILLLLTSTVTWAGPVLNADSCEAKTTDTLNALKILIKNYNGKETSIPAAFQKEAPEYTSPTLYNSTELYKLFKMQRVLKGDKGSWRGEFAGVLFTSTVEDSPLTASLDQHRELRDRPTDLLIEKVSFRLQSTDVSWAYKFVELARISRATNIKIESDLTFHVKFQRPDDGPRFISYLRNWLKRNPVELQQIPFALDVGSGVYIETPKIAEIFYDIEEAKSKNLNEEKTLEYILAQSKFNFTTGLPKNKDINEIRAVLSQQLPPFAPSPIYTERIGDLSRLPETARKRVLHMAATMEGLTVFKPPIMTDFNSVIPKTEPEQSIIIEMIQLLKDPEEIGIFLADLMRETAILIQSSGTNYAKQQLAQGTFPRAYVYEILKRWNQEAGLPPFHELQDQLLDDKFRLQLRKGLFIDHALTNSLYFHGIDTHLLQILFLSRRSKFGPGAVKIALNYITKSEQNMKLWDLLVDQIHSFGGNYHSPEVFTRLFTPYLELY